MKKYLLYILIIVIIVNLFFPVLVKAENNINQQNFYASTVDKNEFYNQIKKQVDLETFKQIVALMEGSGYWYMDDVASKAFIRKKVAFLPQLSLAFTIQRQDQFVVSKKTKFFIPDEDPISVNLGLNNGSSTTDQVMTSIANSLGLPIGDTLVWLNDSRIYQQHPFIFGAIFTNYMREYDDGTQKTNPKDILKTDTINWLYSPVGYLHNYYYNYDLKEFTNKELMTLGSPPGWDADFKYISFIAMTQVAISFIPFSAVAKFFQSIFQPLAKYIPQPLAKMIAYLKTEINIPKIPTGVTPFVKRSAVADTGPLLSQKTVLVGERETYAGGVNSATISELPDSTVGTNIPNIKKISYSERIKELFVTKLDISQIYKAFEIFRSAQQEASIVYEKYGLSAKSSTQIIEQSLENTKIVPRQSSAFNSRDDISGIYWRRYKTIYLPDDSIGAGDYDVSFHEYQHHWDDILSAKRSSGFEFNNKNTLHASVEARGRYIEGLTKQRFFTTENKNFDLLPSQPFILGGHDECRVFDLMRDEMTQGFIRKIAESKGLPITDFNGVIKPAKQLADSIYEEILFATRDAGINAYFPELGSWAGQDFDDIVAITIENISTTGPEITNFMNQVSYLSYQNYDKIVEQHNLFINSNYSQIWK